MKRGLIFGVLAIGLLTGRPALAFDAYNNFGPGDTYDLTTGYAVWGPEITPFMQFISGCRFTAQAGGHLAVIRMALNTQAEDSVALNLVDVRFIAANAVGELGATIASFTRSGLPPGGPYAPPQTIFNSDPLVTLIKGRQYWIVVAPGGSTTKAVWRLNNISDPAERRVASINGGASYFYPGGVNFMGSLRVEVVPEPGDFDVDGDVDGSDFLVWQRGYGITDVATILDGDANNDKAVNNLDYDIWQQKFGYPTAIASVPEPATYQMIVLCSLLAVGATRARGKRHGQPCC